MLCDECKQNQAVFHTKIIKNGIVRTRHLCEECSKKYREEDSFLKSFGGVDDLFSSFAGLMFGDSDSQRCICTKCGTTSDEFIKTGYVGCPDCYRAFEKVIMPAIGRVQHDLRHVGKIPGAADPKAEIMAKMQRLRVKQQEASDAEDYDEAQRCLDQINELKKSLEGGKKDA